MDDPPMLQQMNFVNRLARLTSPWRHARILVTYNEPFIGVACRRRGRLQSALHPLDPALRDTILADLAAGPALEQNPFVRGLRHALQRETHDAFEEWFAWLREPQEDRSLSVGYYRATSSATAAQGDQAAWTLVGLDPVSPDVAAEMTVGERHWAATSGLDPAGSSGPRAVLLEKLWQTFYDFTWRNELRFNVIEAAALAFSKYYGGLGNYPRALHFVERALEDHRRSVHLEAARHTLHLRIDGAPVPPWLEKFVGPDNGYLKDFVCNMPFRRFDIVETGEVNVCCGHWLPKSIGNIDTDDLSATLNSKSAQAIRRSMTDGTYKYCNHLECVSLSQNKLARREDLSDPEILAAMATGDFTVGHVDQMLFAYDQSCNLACPSCRHERIIEKPSQNEAKARNVEVKLAPLLPKLKHLEINVAGELFVSKPSRRILGMITPETCPDLHINLISNGMLFTEAEWNKFPGIHGKVDGVRISIDAARKETFEKLRRFGVHEVLLENLAFLQRLRREELIGGLNLSFTYQLDNFREMEEFVRFAQTYEADKVIFEPLQNVGAFTDEEYRERAVHRHDHPLFAEFLAMIRRPAFQIAGIQHDFAKYDFTAFNMTDLFLSQDFVPAVANCKIEGLRPVADSRGHAFMELPLSRRHRLMIQDNAFYHGRYRFTVDLLPIGARYAGLELNASNQADHARVCVDFAESALHQGGTVAGCSADWQVVRRPDGWCRLSFVFSVTSPAQLSANIFLADKDGPQAYPGDERVGFVTGPIRASVLARSEVRTEERAAVPA
jgi:MoaA/NifB/PqqE/SkfB family radical SAM enzyme